MTKEIILDALRAHSKELQNRFTVRRIGIFGSHARGDVGLESDIDVVVEFDQPTFDHYMDLKFFLEQLLSKKVDLVMADTIKPRLQPYINQEVIYA